MPNRQSSLSFAVQDNQLLITRNGACSHKIQVWPKPEAEMVNEDGFWERFYPEFRLISYPLRKPKKQPDKKQHQLELELVSGPVVINRQTTKTKAYDELRQTMPVSYAMALAPFKSHQWNMIVFLSFHRRFYELIKGNPSVAYLLANRREFNWKVYRRMIKLDELTGMKQQGLLELLGLPGTKQLVQITRKIHPASATPRLIGELKQCLRHEDSMKMLSHLKKINAGILNLLTGDGEIRALATPQLLEEVSTNKTNNHYPAAAYQFSETFRWHRELWPDRKFPVLRNLAMLNNYHEEIMESAEVLLRDRRLRNAPAHARTELLARIRQLLKDPLPQPPIPGTGSIKPIRTAAGLLQEGDEQHHCVGTYVDRVRSGRCYIYRILKPERATLCIYKTSGNQWVTDTLLAACNKPVKRETKLAVAGWLSSAQVGI